MRRLVLTISLVAALTACSDDDPVVQSCEDSSCHGVAGSTSGIERVHPESAKLTCTDCHGGDGSVVDKDQAHVAPAPQFVAERNGYIKNLSVNELDMVDPAYLQFVNPGDYRVAEKTCGTGSPKVDGNGCHQQVVYNAQRSTMSTFVGHFNVPRFQAGMQGREAVLGSRALSDPQRPNPGPPGTVASIAQAIPPGATAPRDDIHTAMDNYLPKNCTHCHQWSYGRNDARGNFRSSGCTSCHMYYNNDGVSLSKDPSAPQEIPPHPQTHKLTVEINETQCEHCHYQGARIGLLFRGVIEWGVSEPPPFPNIGESLHNHTPDFYLQASTDSAHPADLHYDAGMACADCHVGRDVHGDGRIYSTSKFQVSVRCENCHGTVDTTISEGKTVAPLTKTGSDPGCDPEVDGSSEYFLNCNGDPFKRIYRRPDGTVWMRPVKGGDELAVNQIKDLLDRGISQNMIQAMGRDPKTGFSHTEVIECHGCHTAYRQYCFGCHVTMDYSQTKSDLLTGQRTPGAEVTTRDYQSLDLYFVGMNRRGKLASFCPSMQVFTTATDVDAGGTRFDYYTERVRRTATGKVGFNWAVDMPHVTSGLPQNCTKCHADQDNGCDDSKARETYGYGTGRFMFTDGDGQAHDLTQLLAADGQPLIEFSHEGQGPVEQVMRERALSICVQDHPR